MGARPRPSPCVPVCPARACLPLTPPAWASVHGSWSVTLPALWVRTKENGSDRDPLHPDHLSKRPCTLSPAQHYSPSNGRPHPTPPHYRLEDMAVAHHFRDSYRHPDPRELRERHRQLGEQCAGEQGHARACTAGGEAQSCGEHVSMGEIR